MSVFSDDDSLDRLATTQVEEPQIRAAAIQKKKIEEEEEEEEEEP